MAVKRPAKSSATGSTGGKIFGCINYSWSAVYFSKNINEDFGASAMVKGGVREEKPRTASKKDCWENIVTEKKIR